ncbi:Disease resistance family protein / LRR family protein, putative [Theobroma cacao]|uniref:Disease resistance family protein / LRR family protein, putative n=1 Tax=Theobroma cacao TaxID=3641 RepID=A0A061EMG2_THECC|nr:Disease resistance family protein / LRR family protein, putative [Theobroma cacao]
MSAILMVLFFCLAIVNISFNEGCIESERRALFMFKQDLINHANRLASWTVDKDCCDWVGVVCDNVTGHVLQLHLTNPLSTPNTFASPAENEAFERSKLRGKINPSLLMLKHLNYLDLSNNAFEGIPIPKFLGSIESLRYLNLSRAGFEGFVPHQLGNLSSLQILDLHADDESYLYVANLQWLSGLSSLEHLDLGNVNLTKVSNWLKVLNTLPSLQKLYMLGCQLPQVSPPTNLNLSSLAILDLSFNSLENTLVDWIFQLKSLVSLDLSSNNFQGCIFDGLENMTSLTHLDLSDNLFNSSIPDWLYNLNSLQFLSLRSNNLQGLISSAVGNMSSAVSLDFSGNELEGKIPRSMGNLCNLKSIDYSGVNLSQDISDILEILSGCVSKQLDFLGLGGCQLSGQLINRLGCFKNLKVLALDNNSISGPIPWSIGQLSSLSVLILSRNKLTGHLPKSVGLLANLELFTIGFNLLSGVVSEIHFDNLTKLKALSASRNPLVLKVSPNWFPPFQLITLHLISSHIGPQFPLWLGSQKYLTHVDISNSGISDSIPSWFWNSPFQVQYFNLSHNQIHGQIPDIPRTAFVDSVIDLSFNNFSGPLPQVSSNVSFLDLSNNFLFGSLFPLLCHKLKETMKTKILILGKNFLFGEIPNCWMNWQNLMILNLENNKFIGRIPSSMGTLHSLQSLHLNGNQLSGEIPLSLKNCTNLVLLDLNDNELYGHIPKWLGHDFPKLKVLILRSNKFSGYIPDQLCGLDSLQVLDLAYNNLFGSLPRCLSNFSAMVKTSGTTETDITLAASILNSQIFEKINISSSCVASIMMKGQMLEYSTTLDLVRSIDFSNNKLSGEIPVEVTNLLGLRSLNLSNNLLTGTIPKNIGLMGTLESVDFSLNKLSGRIPESMSTLTFLNHLNLSYNNLIGQIPLSTQLQSLEPSNFVGNQLCGLPLPNKCSANGTIQNSRNGKGENDKGFVTHWFWFGMAYGFVVGFWSVFLPLVIDRRRWRSICALFTFQKNLEIDNFTNAGFNKIM